MTETNRWTQKRNLTMLTDFYELTMANGYLKHGMQDKIAYFDMFFRNGREKGVVGLCKLIHNTFFPYGAYDFTPCASRMTKVVFPFVDTSIEFFVKVRNPV